MGPRPASAGKSCANSRQFAGRRCLAHTPSFLANTPACQRDPPPAPEPLVPSGLPPSLLSRAIPGRPTATPFESPRPSPLRAIVFGAFLYPVGASPFYLNSSSLSLAPCLLR